MIYDSVLEIVGSTPMIRLNHLPEKDSAEILVKKGGAIISNDLERFCADLDQALRGIGL